MLLMARMRAPRSEWEIGRLDGLGVEIGDAGGIGDHEVELRSRLQVGRLDLDPLGERSALLVFELHVDRHQLLREIGDLVDEDVLQLGALDGLAAADLEIHLLDAGVLFPGCFIRK